MGDSSWKFSQCFGEKAAADELGEADVLSAVEFDNTGKYLATGDKGGRVVVFETENGNNPKPIASNTEYKFLCEYQSHEPEFDYLKSLEIEEKINQIKWVNGTNGALFMLTTNDKTVKLWKVYQNQVKKVSCWNVENGSLASGGLRVPKIDILEQSVATKTRRVFANAHAYHINSIAPNSDGECFLSADDLRINLWNLDISDQSYTIVDIKPANMEELAEVITAADFHPSQCNVFMYSSSRGSIRLSDMRDRALCDKHSKIFEEEEDPSNKSFFSEIIASISDIKFTRDGRYIVSRDYMTLKIWDVNMEAKPVKTIHIHDYLRPKLCDLYENDSIFDKFECSLSGDGSHFVTGGYNNHFHIYDRYGKSDLCIEAAKMPPRKATAPGSPYIDPDSVDYSKKILHMTWHPSNSVVAVAGLNNLYIYSK